MTGYLLIFVGYLILGVCASYAVVKSATFSNRQKIFQTILIWLVPFAGVGLVLAVHKRAHIDSGVMKAIDNDQLTPGVGGSGFEYGHPEFYGDGAGDDSH